MARLDSGNETLLSDESPCDLPVTPPASNEVESSVSDQHAHNSTHGINEENLVPPKITPFSGVLDKVQVVGIFFVISFAPDKFKNFFFPKIGTSLIILNCAYGQPARLTGA